MPWIARPPVRRNEANNKVGTQYNIAGDRVAGFVLKPGGNFAEGTDVVWRFVVVHVRKIPAGKDRRQ